MVRGLGNKGSCGMQAYFSIHEYPLVGRIGINLAGVPAYSGAKGK